jgi:hypothetical protein
MRGRVTLIRGGRLSHADRRREYRRFVRNATHELVGVSLAVAAGRVLDAAPLEIAGLAAAAVSGSRLPDVDQLGAHVHRRTRLERRTRLASAIGGLLPSAGGVRVRRVAPDGDPFRPGLRCGDGAGGAGRLAGRGGRRARRGRVRGERPRGARGGGCLHAGRGDALGAAVATAGAAASPAGAHPHGSWREGGVRGDGGRRIGARAARLTTSARFRTGQPRAGRGTKSPCQLLVERRVLGDCRVLD